MAGGGGVAVAVAVAAGGGVAAVIYGRRRRRYCMAPLQWQRRRRRHHTGGAVGGTIPPGSPLWRGVAAAAAAAARRRRRRATGIYRYPRRHRRDGAVCVGTLILCGRRCALYHTMARAGIYGGQRQSRPTDHPPSDHMAATIPAYHSDGAAHGCRRAVCAAAYRARRPAAASQQRARAAAPAQRRSLLRCCRPAQSPSICAGAPTIDVVNLLTTTTLPAAAAAARVGVVNLSIPAALLLRRAPACSVIAARALLSIHPWRRRRWRHGGMAG